MTTPSEPPDPPVGGVLGSAKSSPDDADGVVGPIWPPAETEPDAHRHRGGGLRRLIDRLRPGRRG